MGALKEWRGIIRKIWQELKFHGNSSTIQPQDAPAEQKQGRVYEIPAGLLPRFFDLYEELLLDERTGRGAVSSYRLWKFLQQRCPEIKSGKWKLVVKRTSAEVVEVLP